MFEEENPLRVNSDLENLTPLKPHRYPAWVWILVFTIISLLLYSIFTIPKYLTIAKKLQDAEVLFEQKNYLEAFMLYYEAIDVVPQSGKVKFGLALACFALQNINDKLDEEDEFWGYVGFKHLSERRMIENEWKQLEAVMPKRYTQYFQESGIKK